MLQPAKLFSKVEGQIKTFPDKHRPKQFMPMKPVVQETLGRGARGGGRKIGTGLAAQDAANFTGEQIYK